MSSKIKMTIQNSKNLATGPDKSGNYKDAGRGQAPPLHLQCLKERIPSGLEVEEILNPKHQIPNKRKENLIPLIKI
jgi:hypothetical protein